MAAPPQQVIEKPVESPKHQTLPIRWAVATTAFLLMSVGSLAFMSLPPIASYSDRFFGAQSTNNSTAVYFCASFLSGVLAIWAFQRFGLRVCLQLCSVLNCAGISIKLLSCSDLPLMHDARLPLMLIAQALLGFSLPFVAFSSTKLASEWFVFAERPIATAIVNVGAAFGVCLASLIIPFVITPDRSSDAVFDATMSVQLRNLHLGIFVLALLLVPLTFLVLYFASKQRGDVSLCIDEGGWSNLDRVKFVVTNRPFILLTIVFGAGLGVFNALFSLMQQLLCPVGYSNEFAGICNSILIGSSIFGAGLSGVFVSKTRLYDETLKVCMVTSMIAGIAFADLILFPHLAVAVGVCAAIFGFFGGACLPIALELATEAAYPMGESFSNGIVQFSGNICSAINVILSQALARETTRYSTIETCSAMGTEDVKARSWIVAMLFTSGVQAVLQIVFIWGFKPQFNRRKAELQRQKLAEKKDSESSSTTESTAPIA